MFADLVGSTARSASMDAEEYQEIVSSYHTCVADVVDRHGGLVSQYLGDGVLAYFGYPKAHEDDASRSLYAARAIIAEVAGLQVRGPKLQTRIGVATGTVVVGRIFGRSAERERGAVGETPNRAARLQSLADPQTIVVDQRTCRLAETTFQFLDLGLHTIKGFPQPVPVFKVRGDDRESGVVALKADGPFVGRELERAQLDAALNGAIRNRGCLIAIKGDAGIGKSRLLREFLYDATQRGFACHRAHMLDFGTSEAHNPFGVLALGLLGCDGENGASKAAARIETTIADGVVETDVAPFLYDLIGIPLPGDLHVQFDAMDKKRRDEGRRQALASLAVGLSRRQPLVIAVEDVHWADQESLANLRNLCAAAESQPVIMVVTTRPENDPIDTGWRAQAATTPIISLDLAPLSRDAAETLARHLGSHLQARVKECLDRAAGNPLFLEQLLRHDAEGDQVGVPDTVQGIVQARIDRLGQTERLAIQAASILGQQFSQDALQHLLGGAAIDIDRLIAGVIIMRDSDGYRFAHALIHQAVYESVLRAKRRDLHQKAAQWFEDKDKVLVAAHLDRAELREAAARAYLQAARQQAASYRYDAAAHLLERGLELASDSADRGSLLLMQGEVQQDLGHLHKALQAFEEAVAQAVEPRVLCNALIGCAATHRVLDHLAGAERALDQAEKLATTNGLQRELARIAFLRGNLCFPRGDTEGCLREHSKSLAIAREIDAPSEIAAALGGLGDAEYMRGRMLSAHRYFSKCVELAREHALGKTEVANRPMSALTRFLAGEPAQALADSEEAIRLSESTGQLRAQVIAHHAAYLCQFGRLKLEAAAMHATKALELSQQIKAPRFEAEALAFRADVHRMTGSLAAAKTDIDEALAIGRRSGMAYFGPTLLSTAALISSDHDEQRALLAEADATVDQSVSHNHFFLRRNAIDIFYMLKEPVEIDRQVQALEQYTRHERMPWSDFYVDWGKMLAAYLREPAIRSSPAWDALAARAATLWLDGAMTSIPADNT